MFKKSKILNVDFENDFKTKKKNIIKNLTRNYIKLRIILKKLFYIY